MLRRARRPFSSISGWEERPCAWTEEPNLYTPRQSQQQRQQQRFPEPEPYRPIRSQPPQFKFDRYGPSGYQERRQTSPSRAATSDDYYGRQPRYYRGDMEMDSNMMREIERERGEERARARREQEASRDRRRREEEYEREWGRMDRYSGGGGGCGGGGGGNGGWRRRASRWLDTAFDAALDGVEDWMAERHK